MRVRPSLLLPLAALLAICVYRAEVKLDEASAVAAAPDPPAAEVTPAPAPPAPPATPPGHELLSVRGTVALRERPRGDAVALVGPETEFGSPRVLGVAARRGKWLGVVTDEQPNGRLAWVRGGDKSLRARRTTVSLHADLSARRLELRQDGTTVKSVSVAVGTSTSPTPPGRYAVTDKIPGSRYGAYYGCCILALTGHQENPPPGWTGGDRLAIHGTDAPATIGNPASAGCLRAGDADLQVLMRRVPLGTPVFVRS
ncbi:MAG TPA: L,D-transpeptidase [Thermoleophilaceae bacterium]|nr:L,D-transpeptidase [Thermoleophilaceae bacterium]